MTKDEDGGLLSRMVKFVRNPAVSWSDLDQSEIESDNSRYSKQMLKDMIERRRRNDFVRKREFDMLRKIRRASVSDDPNGRPSFFQPSGPNAKPDERAKTIKKIDEIEAQMSQQWWKTKNGAEQDATGAEPNTDFSQSFPQGVETTPDGRALGRNNNRPLPESLNALVQRPSSNSGFPTTTVEPRLGVPVRASQIGGLAGAYDGKDTGFTASKMQAVQVAEFVHDPQLEEAAIRFANGDDEGAEAALLEAIGSEDSNVSGNQAIWLTLFDLYRATDQQERFENAALDFANRFGRSAPMWHSFPTSVRKHQQGQQSGFPASAQEHANSDFPLTWRCPEVLDAGAIATLRSMLEDAPQPWVMNWQALKTINANAVASMLAMFSRWTNESVKLRFIGMDHLLAILKELTPSGDRKVDPNLWRIRLEALRILHQADEFDVVALDCCVTYEVSPPPWEPALCNYKSLDSSEHQVTAPPTILGDVPPDGGQSSLPAEDFTETERAAYEALGANVRAVDLSGHIMGDAVEMLDALNARLEGSTLIVVVCSRLIRLDFLAAGTLLNWVTARQTEGRQVHFKDLHRLVAVFFNVIGINEHAKLKVRID